MKEIGLGLLAIAGVIVMIYVLLICTGVIGIFLINLFSPNTQMPYRWSNIKSEGGKGVIILIITGAILIVAHLVGSIMIS